MIKLLFLKKYLDQLKVKSDLHIMYMPYSRMDRSEGGSAFTLKYIAEFINNLGFDYINVLEPHSDVTTALLNNCKSRFLSVDIFYDIKDKINFNDDCDYVYYPDAGAEKRYSKMIGVPNQLVGFKHRDFQTGKITSLQVFGDVKEKGFKVIMVDDLSSYGGTFILGSKQLRELGASEIYLVVGHCEESIYKGDIFKTDLIDKVFTTDTIINESLNKKIEVYQIMNKKEVKKMKTNPMLMTDAYKISHLIMSEKGTEKIYSTFTPRHSRIEGINEVVFFGLQGFIKDYLIDNFNENFFNMDKETVIADYKRIIKNSLGDNCADTKHIEALHDLGYLPIKIKAVKEGTLIPMKVPVFTIENTHKDFYWLTNFLETLISANMWKVITATTIVKKYRDICEKWAEKTCDSKDHIQWQCHNFSYRGMSGHEDAVTTGAGHLLYFTGSDTIPSIQYLEQYYGANVEKELVSASVLATEHSIQCGYQDDLRYFKQMITEVAPSGIVSIVSDGYDYWNVIGSIVPQLKDIIMARDGKVVVRPDTGSPVKIICGDIESTDELIKKGSVEALWDTFGGTINSKGYKVLDSHISIIYGDSISPEIAEETFKQLEAKGFSAENIVYGVGSYSLGYYTRDTFSFALKATYTVIDGEEKFIFKDPKTDIGGIRKSQKGMVIVIDGVGGIYMVDELNSKEREANTKFDMLEDVFIDGKLVRNESLAEIRARVLK